MPKRRPGCHQKPPKVRQASPRTHFLPKFREKFSAQRSWSDFSMFFGLRTMLAMWKKPRIPLKPIFFSWFFKDGRCRRYVGSALEKTSKNRPRGPPKRSPDPPGTLQNRVRSDPRRTKSSQERQQTQQVTPNAPKKRPRAKSGASMACTTLRIFDPTGPAPPPLGS